MLEEFNTCSQGQPAVDARLILQQRWDVANENIIRRPYDYSTSHPGKNIRDTLLTAFNQVICAPSKSLETICRAISMLHEASLLIDDIQDASELRRGFPAAHKIFGVAETINSANYMYFKALQEIGQLKNSAAASIFCEELISLHRGQGMELFWRESLRCPSERDYFQTIMSKTSGLFRLGIKLMQAESSISGVDCVPLATLMGIIFQVRDDYMSLTSAEYGDAKGAFEDLTEGKFSFPIIHNIHVRPDDNQVLNILKQRTADPALMKHAIQCLEASGSFRYTRSVMENLIERGRAMISEMLPHANEATVVASLNSILAKLAV